MFLFHLDFSLYCDVACVNMSLNAMVGCCQSLLLFTLYALAVGWFLLILLVLCCLLCCLYLHDIGCFYLYFFAVALSICFTYAATFSL